MNYTVSNLFQRYSKELKLIAGRGGLSKEILSCGILDYELLPSLKGKYSYSNFQRGQFILSSLIYAEKKTYLILDAIKHLISKEASGLAIRNVLDFDIPDSILRYAEVKNFPIFIIESMSLPFEKIIYEIQNHLFLLKNDDYFIKVLDRILLEDLSEEDIKKEALHLNASFTNQFFIAYFALDPFVDFDIKTNFIKSFSKSPSFDYHDFFSSFKEGLVYVHSADPLNTDIQIKKIQNLYQSMSKHLELISVGVSQIYNTLTLFKFALKESIFASSFQNPLEKTTYFKDLSTYQIIFPYCNSSEFQNFSQGYLGPIEEFDTENSSQLLETLLTFQLVDQNYRQAGLKLSIHEQTVRYRIRKIYDLLDLNYHCIRHQEELSMACKIYWANYLLNNQKTILSL